MVQGVPELHHEIADALLPQAALVFHHATTLAAAVDMLDPQPALVERLVGALLLPGQRLTAGLLHRHADRHLGPWARQTAETLPQPTLGGSGRGRGLGHALSMGAAAVGVAQQEDAQQSVDQDPIFYRVVALLAAITRFLFNRGLGADEASCGPVMGTRGEAGAAPAAAPDCVKTSCVGRLSPGSRSRETCWLFGRGVRAWVVSTAHTATQPSWSRSGSTPPVLPSIPSGSLRPGSRPSPSRCVAASAPPRGHGRAGLGPG